MVVACNEPFGPIASVIPFLNVGEAIEIANATKFGLPGTVHAGSVVAPSDLGRAFRISFVLLCLYYSGTVVMWCAIT